MKTSFSTASTRRYLIVSVLLYLLSLFTPAFIYTGGKVTGAEALMLGWFPALFGILELLSGKHMGYIGTISWFANLFMMGTCIAILNKRRKISIYVSIVTLCLSSLFFIIKDLDVPDNHTMVHVRAGAGTFFWMCSFIGGWLAALSLEPDANRPKSGGGDVNR